MKLIVVVITFTVFGGFLLTSCGGSNGTSLNASEPEITSQDRQLEIVAFEGICCDDLPGFDQRSQLYTFNRLGETKSLSPEGDSESVIRSAVSPNGESIAYVYETLDSSRGLNILDTRSGDTLFTAPLATGSFIPQMAWLPDSTGLILLDQTLRDRIGRIYRAILDEQTLIELDTNVHSFAISQAGGLLAVMSRTLDDSQPIRLPVAAELALFNLNDGNARMQLDVTGEGSNDFRYAWSPFAEELIYQIRDLKPGYGYIPGNDAASPLWLWQPEAGLQELLPTRQDYPSPFVHYVWLRTDRFLFYSWEKPSFIIIERDGSQFFEGQIAQGSIVAPSPDYTKLAYLAYPGERRRRPQVYVRDLETGDITDAGPASVLTLLGGAPEPSVLRWSDDSSKLAWNREINSRASTLGELYVFDSEQGISQLISASAVHRILEGYGGLRSLFGEEEGNFSWLPGQNRLDYVRFAENGAELVVTDLDSGDTQVVGQVASALNGDCPYARAWRTDEEVLWSRCEGGLYYSNLGLVADTSAHQLLTKPLFSIDLTNNREYGLLRSGTSGELEYWYTYDFVEGELLRVEPPLPSQQPWRLLPLQ
ncbi:MAG: hypothetical protein AAF699_03180 [Pseudomonadota bacterium]